VLVPLLVRRAHAGPAPEAANLDILRDQLAELEADVARGVLPGERYEQARADLERRVLEEAQGDPAPASAPQPAGAWTAAALAARAAPTHTVFIFARADGGPPMPLAVLRKQVRDLPLEFTLDDSMAMAPSLKLSYFAEVVIGARVSRSGGAAPQSGDLQGVSKPVKVGATGVTV